MANLHGGYDPDCCCDSCTIRSLRARVAELERLLREEKRYFETSIYVRDKWKADVQAWVDRVRAALEPVLDEAQLSREKVCPHCYLPTTYTQTRSVDGQPMRSHCSMAPTDSPEED
jgi:hypothetical protein